MPNEALTKAIAAGALILSLSSPAVFGVFVASSANAVSFDCSKASSADERAICSNDELSSLDDAVDAGYREARRSSPNAARPLSRALLAERRSCGSDAACLKAAMTKAIGAYKSVILGDTSGGASQDKVYYGSRAGMQVTVVARAGLNSRHASISVEHRREDAVAYCRDYVQKVTDQCISDELAITLGNKFTGDCKTGRFTTITGQTYVFLGRNRSGSASMGNEFVIINADTNQPLDGSMASGYPVALPQFQALCPAGKLSSR
ncbi:hypothetical protein G6L94_11975 [Agrobacterium rhizogenes]|nr:hypothetical protein [Rhizobium rhizogenes]NTI94407.1 hypothetical protein [Rhizobium rhizogenes]NTJ56874.1 hypothetical protein [Rhizobium rhizogenes]